MRILLGCLCLVTIIGCGDELVAPGIQPLVGQWQAPTEPLQPRGSLDRLLVITTDGRSESHVIDRGLYEGQAPGDLAAEIVLYGRIQVRGSYFTVLPDSEVTHDLFYSPHRSVQREFWAGPEIVRGSRFGGTSSSSSFIPIPRTRQS